MTEKRHALDDETLPGAPGAPGAPADWSSEIEAMQKICVTLQPLEHDARVRIMASALCMYDQAMAERVMRWWRDSR